MTGLFARLADQTRGATFGAQPRVEATAKPAIDSESVGITDPAGGPSDLGDLASDQSARDEADARPRSLGRLPSPSPTDRPPEPAHRLHARQSSAPRVDQAVPTRAAPFVDAQRPANTESRTTNKPDRDQRTHPSDAAPTVATPLVQPNARPSTVATGDSDPRVKTHTEATTSEPAPRSERLTPARAITPPAGGLDPTPTSPQNTQPPTDAPVAKRRQTDNADSKPEPKQAMRRPDAPPRVLPPPPTQTSPEPAPAPITITIGRINIAHPPAAPAPVAPTPNPRPQTHLTLDEFRARRARR